MFEARLTSNFAFGNHHLPRGRKKVCAPIIEVLKKMGNGRVHPVDRYDQRRDEVAGLVSPGDRLQAIGAKLSRLRCSDVEQFHVVVGEIAGDLARLEFDLRQSDACKSKSMIGACVKADSEKLGAVVFVGGFHRGRRVLWPVPEVNMSVCKVVETRK